MKKIYLIGLFLLSSNLMFSQFEDHFGISFVGGRYVKSTISPTNIGLEEDYFKMIRPTFLTLFAFSESYDKAFYTNFRGLGFANYILRSGPTKHPDMSLPGQRPLSNSYKRGTDFSIMTFDLYGYWWGDKVKFGLGGTFQWNAEGTLLQDHLDAGFISDQNNSGIGKYGAAGLGSGVYRVRYRTYLGIGPAVQTSFADGRLKTAINTSVGPYTGGGMAVAELVTSFAVTEHFGFFLTAARRRKNFNEYENLPEVTVKTNDLNFGIWLWNDKWD
jgi:hypothetical protein